MTKRHHSIAPSHPGAMLREFNFPVLNRKLTQIAKDLDISFVSLSKILNEQAPVTPEFSVKLGKYFGNDGDIWWKMQSEYDLWKAKKETDVSNIPTIQAAE